MSKSIMIEAAASAKLQPAPISPDWILSGAPEAQYATLSVSQDGMSSIFVWECSAGRFNWHFSEDETIVVISGAVFVTAGKGEERRLGEGDVGYFPAGSSCICRIDDHVKKIAVLRKELPAALILGFRAWHKFLRIVGRSNQAPSAQALHV